MRETAPTCRRRQHSRKSNGKSTSKGKVQKAKVGKSVDGRRQTVDRRWRSHPLLHFAFCALPFDFPICLLPTALCLLCLFAGLSFAQSAPYASINRDAVNYSGPGREVRH